MKRLSLLSLTHLAVDLNQGALPALLPFFKEVLNLSYALLGSVVFFSNLSSSIIQPLFGYISDKRSSRWILPLSPVVAGIGIGLSGLSGSYVSLVLLVVITGIGVALFHPEGFKEAYSLTSKKKATGVSFFAFGGSLGLALGPIFAISVCAHFGLRGTPIIMIPALVVSLLLFLSAPLNRGEEPLAVYDVKREQTSYARSQMRSFILLTVVATIRAWAQFGMATYIPFYYINYLKGDPIHAGKLASTFLLSGALGTLLGGPVADRFGHKKFLLSTLALSSLFLNLFFFMSSGRLAFILIGLSGLILISSFGTTTVMGQTILHKHLALASGMMVGFTISAGGLGLTILGMVADAYGVPWAIRIISFLPLFAASLGMFIDYPQANK